VCVDLVQRFIPAVFTFSFVVVGHMLLVSPADKRFALVWLARLLLTHGRTEKLMRGCVGWGVVRAIGLSKIKFERSVTREER
jgi:hypothetical protein